MYCVFGRPCPRFTVFDIQYKAGEKVCFEISKLISVDYLTYTVKKKKSSGGNWGHVFDKQHGGHTLINESISFYHYYTTENKIWRPSETEQNWLPLVFIKAVEFNYHVFNNIHRWCIMPTVCQYLGNLKRKQIRLFSFHNLIRITVNSIQYNQMLTK